VKTKFVDKDQSKTYQNKNPTGERDPIPLPKTNKAREYNGGAINLEDFT
jgi:hypothetical protein